VYNRSGIFASYLEVALGQALNNMLVLAPKGVMTITLDERHNPDAFYQTRSGLCVLGDFLSRIVARAKSSEVGMTFKVEGFDLQQDLTGTEINAALPKGHLFDETQVCAVIGGLIAKQPNGEKRGALINNGYANLFYTPSCVVVVHRLASYGEWHVVTFGRNCWWGAGRRVFSPAN